MVDFLKEGNKIHIKELNKGSFTRYCGGKVTDECILKGKKSPSAAIRKKATFAANARKWRPKYGGGGAVALQELGKGLKYILGLAKKDPKLGNIANLVTEVSTPRTKALGTFIPHTSKLSVRELLGLSKGAYGSLNKYEKAALDDYAYYVLRGKNQSKLMKDLATGELSRGHTVPRGKTLITGPGAVVKLGDIRYYPANNQVGVFIDEGYRAAALPIDLTGKGFLINAVLTPERIADMASQGGAVAETAVKIPKRGIYRFVKGLDSAVKPGSYISGEAGRMPLGGAMIEARNPSEAVKLLLSEADKVAASGRSGLSPDSYKFMVGLGQRPGYRLRFSRDPMSGLNNTAVDNKYLYDAFAAAKTPEQKLAFIELWNKDIYPNSAYLNNGNIEILQPFIYKMKHGGKV